MKNQSLGGFYQKGMSPAGAAFVAMVMAGLAYTGIILFPHYMDSLSINSAFEEIAQRPDAAEESLKGLNADAYQIFITNNIRGINPDNIAFLDEDDSGEVIWSYKYEIKEPLFYNVTILLTFEDEFVLESSVD